MSDKVSFSSASQTFEEISDYYKVTAEALRKYYNFATIGNPIPSRFVALSQEELEKELNERLNELDKNVSLNLLSAIEASLRIDYLNRVYRREKNNLSRTFRCYGYTHRGTFARHNTNGRYGCDYSSFGTKIDG